MMQIAFSLLYDPFLAYKKALDSVPSIDHTMDRVLATLRKKELQQMKMKIMVKNIGSKVSRPMPPIRKPKGKHLDRRSSIDALMKRTICKACGKKGHWAKVCRDPTGSDPKPASIAGSSKSDGYFPLMAYINECHDF